MSAESAAVASSGGAGTVRTASGVELSFEVEGTGDALVLIAGLADDRSSWGSVAPALAESRRVVTFDNRGIGRSSTPAGPYTIEQMADDAHSLIAELELGPADVLGSSMGGAIAMSLAARHPQAVNRLVLANTWLQPEPYLRLLFGHWRALAAEGNERRLMESGALFAFSAPFLSENPDRLEELVGGDAPPLDGYAAAADACLHHDARPIAGTIGHRTLVIGGAQDMLTRPSQSRLLAEALPDARLEWLDTGHMTFWEQPGRFVELVRGFLATP